MTASGSMLSVGAKLGYIFELNAAGYPAAPDDLSCYEGIELAGIKGFELSSPNARLVTHMGNDRVLAVDFLPTTEPVSGEIRVAPSLQGVNASLTNNKQFTVGEMSLLAWSTENQGSEEDISLLIFQQALDKDTKLRAWRGLTVARARAIPVLAPMNDNPSEFRYQVIASPSTKHIWGTALATGTEGATEAAAIETMTGNKPKIVAWQADGSEDNFVYPASKMPISDAKTVVWLNGVLQTSGGGDYTWDVVTGITFDTPPNDHDIIVSWYEYA